MAGAITGSAAALSALGWAGQRLWRIGKSVGDLHDDWRGEPDRPGVKGRPGVMQRLAAIEGELTVNGGRSLRDAIGRIEQQFTDHLAAHSTTPLQVNVGTQPPPADIHPDRGGST